MLLHICCAPDATVPWPALAAEGFDVTGFFYGGNIHPVSEWELRRGAVSKLSGVLGMDAEIAPYDPDAWLSETAAFADEREGGARCEVCFGMQLASAANFASERGFDCVCTTLSISPHKNPAAINRAGRSGAGSAGVEWVERVWRKNDGFKLSVARSREMGLYRQNYCGCVYSERHDERGSGDER